MILKKYKSLHLCIHPLIYNLPFVLIPFLIIYFYVQLRIFSGPYMLNCFDPEYTYLLNGICLGQLKFDLGHVDNPGTPLQVIAAIVTRIVHVFNQTDKSYAEDIISNPQFYLSAINIVNVSLVSLAILITGIYIYRLTRNIGLSLLVQFTPFAYLTFIVNTVRIFPEVVLIIPVLIMIVALIHYIYDANSKIKLNKYIIAFSLISGLGLSFKLDFLSLLLIPLIVIPSLKYKARYLLVSLVSFFIFAFPVLWKLNFFFHWVKGLFIHSGRYGTGDSNVINTSDFFNHISNLFETFRLYFIVLILLLIVAIIFLIKRLNLKNGNYKLYKVLLGLIASFTFHIALVSKHFSHHYMLPSLYLTCFAIFIFIEILGKRQQIIKGIVATVIIIVLGLAFYKSFAGMAVWKKEANANKITVIEDTRSIVTGKPFIIIAQPYDFYFEESGLLFGLLHTGKHVFYFKKIFKKCYPDIFIYDCSITKFFYWADFFPPDEFLKKYDNIYVFVDAQQLNQKDKIFSLLGPEVKEELLYSNDNTGDKVFRISRVKE